MNIPIEDIYVSNSDEIQLYIIGYESMGESIVLNIANKFFGVIDCYRTDNLFITKSILESIETKNLNFICWTHTDEDHTKGMLELFDYVNEDTVFIMPEGIPYKELIAKVDLNSCKYCDEEIVGIFNAIKDKIKRYNFISANSSTSIYSFNLKLMNDMKTTTVNIECFAPLSSVVRDSQIKTIDELINESKKIHEKPNRYSVGLIINFITDETSRKICLTGDVDEITINNMHPINRKKIFGNNYIIKLPHHGSNNPNKILTNKIVTYFDYAVSTSYKQHDLPRKDIMESYKKCCSTGVISKTNSKDGNYGCVVYKIPIFNLLKDKNEVSYVGSAGEV